MNRIEILKNTVMESKPGICTERALILTKYFKKRKNRKKPPCIANAEALRDVLLKKSIKIYPHELIVGNYTSKRVGGSIYPELHGIPVLEDIFRFSGRETNPLEISGREIRQLLKIVPFWLFRFLSFRAFASPFKKLRFIFHQLKGYYYLINETGGISHIAPDYEKLVKIGAEGIKGEAREMQKETEPESDKWYFYEAVKIIMDAVAQFGCRYSKLAEQMARGEKDEARKKELEEIAKVCGNVPKNGAVTFREAVQSVFFAQIAVNLESLDNAVCPGRMDSYLYPYYKNDIEKGIITRESAKEIISLFSIKMSEIIPVFSERITNFHGGMFNGQVVTVGGVDSGGSDSTNELSYIFLEVMDELRMRQPNFHARIHAGSPEKYIRKINSVLLGGSNSPALYNDDVIIKTMIREGYTPEDARDYTGVGCVEPVSQGRSFSSTDAALVNVPVLLELALNEGRKFGEIFLSGVKTPHASKMKSMDDLLDAFESQLKFQIKRLVSDLQAIELANRRYHPTPLTSSLLQGCLRTGRCSTAGGAKYNFSGIQCVGPVDTGDALYAVEKAVFMEKKLSLDQLVKILKNNIDDAYWLTYLRGLEKFGNDHEDTDKWTVYTIEKFIEALKNSGLNTRGGRYVAGLYSVTAHEYFGRITGALPHGRRKGASFASGICPGNGMDRYGPTALLNSVNRIDFTKVANGINFNLKFDRSSFSAGSGAEVLRSLIAAYFLRGGMQVQINILDRDTLVKARENPALYPGLLVRVSGYSAYFNDLTPAMKDEIIERRIY